MCFVIHGNLASTGHGMDFKLVKLISQNVLSKWIRECTNCNCLAIKNELTLILSNFIENHFVWLSKRGSDGFRCDCRLWSGINQFSEFSVFFPFISPSLLPSSLFSYVLLESSLQPESLALIISDLLLLYLKFWMRPLSKGRFNFEQVIVAITGHGNKIVWICNTGIKSSMFAAFIKMNCVYDLKYICRTWESKIVSSHSQNMGPFQKIRLLPCNVLMRKSIYLSFSFIFCLCLVEHLFLLGAINFMVNAIVANWIVIPTLKCVV